MILGKRTLILGASTDPSRYSFMAANRLVQHGHEIIPVGIKGGSVAGTEILPTIDGIEKIHTVTMYLSPKNQEQYEDFLQNLHPERVIFNPGSENPELMQKLTDQSIEVLEACTLIMLGTGQY
jgi:predicted CoA-binding protein